MKKGSREAQSTSKTQKFIEARDMELDWHNGSWCMGVLRGKTSGKRWENIEFILVKAESRWLKKWWVCHERIGLIN